MLKNALNANCETHTITLCMESTISFSWIYIRKLIFSCVLHHFVLGTENAFTFLLFWCNLLWQRVAQSIRCWINYYFTRILIYCWKQLMDLLNSSKEFWKKKKNNYEIIERSKWKILLFSNIHSREKDIRNNFLKYQKKNRIESFFFTWKSKVFPLPSLHRLSFLQFQIFLITLCHCWFE